MKKKLLIRIVRNAGFCIVAPENPNSLYRFKKPVNAVTFATLP